MPRSFPQRVRAFTLVELLVSLAVLTIIMLVLLKTISGVTALSRNTSGRAGAFSAARAAFEALERNLSQATLGTHLGYGDKNGFPVPLVNPSMSGAAATAARAKVPTQYVMTSELHFITGDASKLLTDSGFPASMETPGQAVFFQATTGFVDDVNNRPKDSLLNVLGYYISFGSDSETHTAITQRALPPRYRYRLMEVLQPAEKNGIYASTCEVDSNGMIAYSYDLRWIKSLALDQPSAPKYPLAENVIALVIYPKASPALSSAADEVLTYDYSYDSRLWEKGGAITPLVKSTRNQLPPLVELVLVSIDEPSAKRLEVLYGGPDGSLPPFKQPAVLAKLNLQSLFQSSPTYGNDQLEADINTLEKGLSALGVQYRVFRTQVNINAAQWSNH